MGASQKGPAVLRRWGAAWNLAAPPAEPANGCWTSRLVNCRLHPIRLVAVFRCLADNVGSVSKPPVNKCHCCSALQCSAAWWTMSAP